jgi:hypothetical protein
MLRDMTVAEQERKEREEYLRVLPEIVESIRQGEEPVALSQRLAPRLGEVDQKLLYRWIQLTEEKLDAARRRHAALLATGMWIGVVAVVVPVVAVLLGSVSIASRGVIVSVALGGVLAAVAAIRLKGVTRRAFQRWLDRELS